MLALGVAHVAQGDTDAARVAFERALAATPNSAAAMHELALLARVRPGDPLLGKLQALTKDAARLPPLDRARMHYALGKAYDDLGEPKRALDAFADGAGVFHRHRDLEDTSRHKFDEDDGVRAHDVAVRLFTGRALKPGKRESGYIFIVGMPRTGTTMTEQILLGDARVGSVGETYAFPESAWPWLAGLDPLQADAAALDALFQPERLEAAARNYELRVQDYDAGAAAIVLDKTPPNYVWAPLAVAALGGRIVHCSRNALDTCWSLYTTWFGAATSWSYDFAAIARTYGRYHRLMGSWREALGEAMIDAPYEVMVAHPPEMSAKLYAHCGLAWRPEVLDFAASGRTVITPSRAQVRKAVSASSVRRVAPYLPYIEPLLEALSREGVTID
jgi:hypothetical protein